MLAQYAQRDKLTIDQKGRNDFVSQADREAEAVIFAVLAQHFPQDGLLGEETGQAGVSGAALVWCIDKLDGISNFLKGAHNWCVSIGLLAQGLPVLGVVHDPVRNEMFEGAQGLGARENGKSMRVSLIDAPDRTAIGIGHVQRVPVDLFCVDTAALLNADFAFRQVGAGALMLAYLAAGRIDAYFERHMWPRDAVAGLALLREAGGQFAPYQTAQVTAGDLVMASNGHLQAEPGRILLSQPGEGRTRAACLAGCGRESGHRKRPQPREPFEFGSGQAYSWLGQSSDGTGRSRASRHGMACAGRRAGGNPG